MKKRVVLSHHALADLKAIAGYTRRTWGARQRKAYLADMKTAVMALGSMPGIGRPRDEIKPGWRSIPCGSHVILYREFTDRVEVLRLFHGSQDVNADIPKDTP
jgi:toxin ParE1/3/4